MSDPAMIKKIKEAVTIPVMAKVRIGHFVEAQILEALEVDYIDESEVLTMADEENHINKHNFKIPFVCGCRNLGEALRRIGEGCAMLRTKGEAGTGNVVEAVRHARAVHREIRMLQSMDDNEVFVFAKEIQAPLSLVMKVKELGRLPIVNFAAGGWCCGWRVEGTGTVPGGVGGGGGGGAWSEIFCRRKERAPIIPLALVRSSLLETYLLSYCGCIHSPLLTPHSPIPNPQSPGVATPADAALMMQLGMDGVFVGSGIFKSSNPAHRARAIVEAVAHYKDASVLARVSENLGQAMVGITDLKAAQVKFREREGGNMRGKGKPWGTWQAD